MSWKCLFSIMSLKNRRFSLDSYVSVDPVGHLGVRRGSSRFSSKKSRQSQSLDEARLAIQELDHSLSSNISQRRQTIAEKSLDQSDGIVSRHSFLKHNRNFHKLFQEIPEVEPLRQTFTCALQKEVLYHGKLFVSENHVCFHSSVLLKETKVVIPASSVREVKKHNSALNMLSIQTADGEKYSFASLRHRELCYDLLQSVCSHAQGESVNSSPRHSSAENEADHDEVSSISSFVDSIDQDLSRQNSLSLDNGLPLMSADGETTMEDTEQDLTCSPTRQSSLTGEDDRAASWIWRIVEGVAPFFLLREIRNLSFLFYCYMMLMVLLLLASGYIGLRITALEEQLRTLGALTEVSFHHREYPES